MVLILRGFGGDCGRVLEGTPDFPTKPRKRIQWPKLQNAENLSSGCCKRRSAKGVRLFSGLFRLLFGHFFWCFCHFFHHFFAKLLLPDSFCGRVISRLYLTSKARLFKFSGLIYRGNFSSYISNSKTFKSVSVSVIKSIPQKKSWGLTDATRRAHWPYGPVDLPQTGFGSSARNRRTMAKKWVVASPKNGWKTEKWTKNDIFEPFLGDFSHFPAIFPPLPRWSENPFFGNFARFRPKARKQSVAGQRDRSGENNTLGKYSPKNRPLSRWEGSQHFEN